MHRVRILIFLSIHRYSEADKKFFLVSIHSETQGARGEKCGKTLQLGFGPTIYSYLPFIIDTVLKTNQMCFIDIEVQQGKESGSSSGSSSSIAIFIVIGMLLIAFVGAGIFYVTTKTQAMKTQSVPKLKGTGSKQSLGLKTGSKQGSKTGVKMVKSTASVKSEAKIEKTGSKLAGKSSKSSLPGAEKKGSKTGSKLGLKKGSKLRSKTGSKTGSKLDKNSSSKIKK